MRFFLNASHPVRPWGSFGMNHAAQIGITRGSVDIADGGFFSRASFNCFGVTTYDDNVYLLLKDALCHDFRGTSLTDALTVRVIRAIALVIEVSKGPYFSSRSHFSADCWKPISRRNKVNRNNRSRRRALSHGNSYQTALLSGWR